MRISAVVGSKDEAGLLGPAVTALLRAGFATVSILDDHSTDGTAAVIADLTRNPQVFSITPQDGPAQRQDLDGPVFGQVLRRDAPDWLFFCDADEFCLPKSGRISDTAGLAAMDVISVERYNVAVPDAPLTAADLLDDAFLRRLELILDRQLLSRAKLTDEPETRWILHRIVPKVLVRPATVASFGLGGHSGVGRDGRKLKVARAEDLLIAHLPFSTFARFEQKVRNIVAVLEHYDEATVGGKAWHWFYWREQFRKGHLAQEFDRQILDAATRAMMRAAGGLASADELFARPATDLVKR